MACEPKKRGRRAWTLAVVLASGMGWSPGLSMAQESDGSEPAAEEAATEEAVLLSPEELQTLVAPIALYPDTLLIQVLVAATYPLDIVKANAFLQDNAGTDPASLEEEISTKGWDDSVTVLTTAFPDVLTDMATHVEWTDTMGTAMLAQSDDVMDAVQVKRTEADEAGTLTSNDQQTVEVTQEGDAGDTIIIQPTDPEVVYVPQYDPEVIYTDPGTDVGDVVTAGLIAFGTFALIDEIFDDDDPWNDYWGCRNCGGWNGRPIVNNPDIDIDVDGDVNIGNRPDIGWKPDDKRRDDARDKIADHKNPDRPSTLPVTRPDRGDQMRESLSTRTGAQDISRDRAAADRVADRVERPGGGSRPSVDRGKLPQADRTQIQERTKSASRPAAGNAQVKKPAAAAKKASVKKAPQRKASPNRGGAMQKSGSAGRAKAGGARGRASAGGRPKRR
ncbi:MAG: DUF3300 domain-containing protein [Pseudomonadota bacterium]